MYIWIYMYIHVYTCICTPIYIYIYTYIFKDFFLEGTHGDILDACSSCVRRELNLGHTFCSMPDEAVFDVEHFTTCLGFLLHHQYVDCTGEGLGVYQVVQGSGMGAKHSPAVSSLNFYWWVEKPLFEDRVSNNIAQGIDIWGRYHDDILCVTKNVQVFPGIRDCICSLASKCYKVSLDECSLVGVSMLDLFVWKGPRFDASGALDFRPYIKPTARHIPLINSSRHLPSILAGRKLKLCECIDCPCMLRTSSCSSGSNSIGSLSSASVSMCSRVVLTGFPWLAARYLSNGLFLGLLPEVSGVCCLIMVDYIEVCQP